MIETATSSRSAVARAMTPELRPFQRLEPTAPAELAKSAQAGLPILDELLAPAVPAIVQCLVNFSFQISKKVSVWRTAPSMSVLNRRRRVGRQWIQAVLDGRVDAATLHWVAHTALPQLVGSGPDVHRGVAAGRDCFEYLRGAATARIMAEPDENLVPRATALHAMESVLVMHLGAFEQAVAESRLR